MFSSKSALQEARIADLKEAHEARVKELMRLVSALAEQVEYERARNAAPTWPTAPGAPASDPQGADPLLSVSEEEEQLLALQEFGHIDQIEVARIREELLAHGIDAVADTD